MSELTFWEQQLGSEYAPRWCFELRGNVLGLAWEVREKHIAETPFVEFLLVSLIHESGRVMHYTTYSCPKTLVLRIEPFKRTRKESTLADLLHQLHAAFVGGAEGQ